MKSHHAKAVIKKTGFKLASFFAGFGASAASYFPYHEFGHLVSIRALGAKINDVNADSTGFYIYVRDNYLSQLDYALIASGGPLANYAAAFTAAFLSKKTKKHPKLKAGLKGFSLFQSIAPAYHVVDEIVIKKTGDFYNISRHANIPEEILIPLVVGSSLALCYYSLKDYLKKN